MGHGKGGRAADGRGDGELRYVSYVAMLGHEGGYDIDLTVVQCLCCC